jgi:hypothetical protein
MKAKAISSQATMRGAGETGVSCSSSAAGRKAASCGRRWGGSRSLRIFQTWPKIGGVALEQVERSLQAEGEDHRDGISMLWFRHFI